MLTFENGPHETHSVAVLDSLKKHKYRATFFLHGEKVAQAFSSLSSSASSVSLSLSAAASSSAASSSSSSLVRIIRRMVADGHEIGISSLDSHSWSDLPTNEIVSKLAVITMQLSNITGIKPELLIHIRPPNGEQNVRKYAEISKLSGKDVVMPTLDAKDWEGASSENIVQKNIIPFCKPGEIVSLRDTLANTAQAMPLLLAEFCRQHYELLTIAEVRSFPDDTPK